MGRPRSVTEITWTELAKPTRVQFTWNQVLDPASLGLAVHRARASEHDARDTGYVDVTFPAGTVAAYLPEQEGAAPERYIDEPGDRFEEAMGLPHGRDGLQLYRLPNGTELFAWKSYAFAHSTLEEGRHAEHLKFYFEETERYERALERYRTDHAWDADVDDDGDDDCVEEDELHDPTGIESPDLLGGQDIG
jgi:hypothetical protein